MPNYESIQGKIQKGRGKAAAKLGPPFDIYRVGASASGAWVSPSNKIRSGHPIIYQIGTGKINRSLETDNRLGMIWFEMKADLSEFRLGDIFILNDPVFGLHKTHVQGTEEITGLCLVTHGAIKSNAGARINTFVKVYRLGKTVDSSGYYSPSLVGDSLPLRLVNGSYILGAAGETPDLIPAGIQAHHRTYGDRQVEDVPGMGRKSSWAIYLPPLPGGFKLQEGDRIVAADESSYQVLVPFYQETGAVGHQLFCEREVAND